jgi:hypothetical protein
LGKIKGVTHAPARLVHSAVLEWLAAASAVLRVLIAMIVREVSTGACDTVLRPSLADTLKPATAEGVRDG